MELTYYGRTCVRIRGREATIVHDPYTSIVGPTGRGINGDIVTFSHPDDAPLARAASVQRSSARRAQHARLRRRRCGGRRGRWLL
jgi:hypothetical protein